MFVQIEVVITQERYYPVIIPVTTQQNPNEILQKVVLSRATGLFSIHYANAGLFEHLEEQGIPHRDIKPDNIAVGQVGRGDKLHLVLFDFSLSRSSADNIRAGTTGYLDPLLPLRKPARWDLHAERYAAAITLYELATGELEEGMFRGRSVLEGGQATAGKPATFAEQHHRGPYQRYSVVEDGAKLIRSERKKNGKVSFEFYENGFEIEQVEGRADPDPGALERLEASMDLLRRAAKAHYDRFIGDTETESLTPEDLAELQALGYVE